jgi:hypothetical protein
MKVRLAAVALLMSLTGCATTDTVGSATDDAPAGSNRPSEDAEAEAKRIAENEAAAAAAAAEEEAANSTATFGKTYTWEDGIAVTVSAPEPFKRSEYAAGGEDAAAYVAFTITVVNGTSAPFDVSMFTASAQSGNTEAESVFDTENKLEGSPSTKLLAGREAKFRMGFGVSDPADIVLEIAPSFEHNSVLFTS